MNIRERLFLLQDLKYQEFHSKICPKVDNIIGVKVPELKKLAKELYKEDKEILYNIQDKYYEEIMLQGLIISLTVCNIDKKKELIDNFVHKINNWAVCDVFCSNLRLKKDEKQAIWNFLKKYYESKSEFETRFLIIMLLDHFLDEEHLDDICNIIENIKLDKYYVKMAKAWLLSIMYIKYPKYTLDKLNVIDLDNWTYNKTIQKIVESKRVPDSDKICLRKLKK